MGDTVSEGPSLSQEVDLLLQNLTITLAAGYSPNISRVIASGHMDVLSFFFFLNVFLVTSLSNVVFYKLLAVHA